MCAGKVRASLVKTSDQINRQRISELVQLQSSSGPAQSAAKELSLADVKFSLSELRDSRSVENVSCSTTHKDSEDIDSEIATIARRIRDRLMMPSSTRITGGHDSVPEC